jgi:hypothetical protein
MGAHKMYRMALALTFLEQYHKHGDKSLNHIVTNDETWVSSVNAETKEQQSKQWMHTHSPDKPKMFKQTSARKLMATVYKDSDDSDMSNVLTMYRTRYIDNCNNVIHILM